MSRRDLDRFLRLLFDAGGLILAWYGTAAARLLLNPYMKLQFSRDELFSVAPSLVRILLFWLAASLWLSRAARRRGEWSLSGELPSVFESALFADIVAIVSLFFTRQFGQEISRSFVLLFLPSTLVCLMMMRLVAMAVAGAVDLRWPATERIAVLGEGPEAQSLMSHMQSLGGGTLTVMGLILPKYGNTAAAEGTAPVLGTLGHLAELINTRQLDRIIVAAGSLTGREVDECGAISRRMGVTMSQRLAFAQTGLKVELGNVCGMPLLDMRPVTFTRGQEMIKRAIDILGSGVLLVCSAPLLAVIAALVKLTSDGPVLYKSLRVGRGGRYFTFLKFRSMYRNKAGKRTEAGPNEKSGHIFKVRRDPRVTPLGRILRRCSLDELPQLINVLRGDMSLVGPRPLPAEDLEPDGQSRKFAIWSEVRSRALPGITGLWQIRGRSTLTFEAMIEYDTEYVHNWSVLADLKILAETPLAVIAGRGAF